MDEYENVNTEILVDNSIQILNSKEFKNLSAYELTIIVAMLNRLEYFHDMKESLGYKGLQALAKCIKIKKIFAQNNVIEYGDEGRTFYVVLKGLVNVFVPDFKKKTKELEFHKILTLGRGSSFGVLSIINKKPRSATVTCEDDTILAEIQYEDYVTILKEIENPKINNFIAYMKSFDLFKNLPRSYIERFYFISEKISFIKGDVIFKEGNQVDGIYFIKSGIISVNIYLFRYIKI
jgi:CRP-like cAMP-binding protein